jgi:nitrogen fixation protein NifU and related proteins
MEQLYQQLILDHGRERHGYGLAGSLADPGTAESFQVNPTCGDEVRLRVATSSSAGALTLDDVSWEGSGCSISQASTSVLVDLVAGQGTDVVERVAEDFRVLMHGRGEEPTDEAAERLGDAIAFAGVARYPARVKCALLGWMALKDALARAGS